MVILCLGKPSSRSCLFFPRKKAHKHKIFALVNVQMALGQTDGCPRINRAKKFMCSPRNTGNINFSLTNLDMQVSKPHIKFKEAKASLISEFRGWTP